MDPAVSLKLAKERLERMEEEVTKYSRFLHNAEYMRDLARSEVAEREKDVELKEENK